ncbi:MAG: hypothetical protein R3275_11590 [Saprospiraceae bacterium]|nr:hypothetical protein [Saprospiraceae bacterium]
MKVIDTRNGNSCWSNILVEDKLPPEVTCLNDTFPCYVDPFSVDYSIYATASENCDDSVALDHAFFFRELGCASNEFVSYVELRWTAEDDQGLTDQCVSLIFFERVSIDSTEFPLDTTISCPLSDTFDFGEPLIDSLPVSPLCDLVSFFEDDTIAGRCSGEFEIRREWTVMDICANRTILDTQIITVIDTVPPDLICADSVTIGTESATCTALYVVPPVAASDECGEDSQITFMIRIEGQGMVNVGDTVELDTGSYDVMIYAEDDCGNIDSCDQVLTVVDDVAPVLICIPDLEIYLDSMGNAPDLCLADLDHMNFYFDNCGIDSLFIAKMVDFCDTTRNNQFGTCVEFCCADVGNEVMVIIKAQDAAGNMNFCMINTMVLDTIAPVITSSPPDTMISCTVDYTDTSNTGGGITVMDNCAEELTIKITDSVDLDACEEGTVTRTFIACDPSGNADTAVQIITIFNDFRFDSSLVFWAQDTCVESCPPDSLPETIGSQTYVMGDSCGVVEVTYTDVDITDTTDACQVIERTWRVQTECGDTVDIDSVQIVTIKNFRPPVLSGPPIDTTIESDPDSCGAFVALPRLVATDCSTGLMVTNDCTNTGDSIAMFFPVGEKTITFTATDACGNTSTYQTTIRVVDNAGPSLTCPPDTTVNCNTPTDTSVTGVPIVSDNCDSTGGSLSLVFMDSIVGGACTQEMTIFRTWTAEDSSGNVSTCTQMIEVQDTTPPVITCPPDVTVSCEESTNSNNTGMPSATDNCDMTLNNFMESDSIGAGNCASESTIFRTWTIMDDCGNMSSCVQRITVVDTIPPMIDCPDDITVECTDQTDPMTTGFPTISDNCDPNPTSVFEDSIVDGQGQIIRTIFRTWTATDLCGNEASCTQEIVVQDTVPPTLVCPDDVTIGCDSMFMDLSEFGEPDTSDNCLGIILTKDTIYDLNLCNVGTITRKFIARDSAGNVDSCEQVITIEMTDSLEERDIIWPDSAIQVDACDGVNPDSIPRGRPEIDSSMAACFKVSITFEDSVDYNCRPGGICSTLVRKWTVIDSCQLDTLGNGIFCFEQNIEVIDTTPPVITGIMSDTVYLHPDSMCSAFFRIVADAEDCSGIKSITNNSPFGVDTLRNASGRYPRGLTPVTFIAEDSCCNADTQLIFIVVLDTIPPVITCRDVILRIRGEMPNESAEICISELIISATDNCDPRIDLRASFDPNDPTDTCRVYNCDSLGGQKSIMRNLTIYIQDNRGNTSTCVSKVTVEDDLEICDGASIISGQIYNINNTGIENAEVNLMNMGMTEMTDNGGNYSFPEMDNGQSYLLRVERSDDPLNGVSIKDIILIQRHLLGISEFDSPYQYLAADLNASNSIEVSDIVRLRQLILGRIRSFPQVPDWYFVFQGYKFNDITHPLLETEAFSYYIDTLSTNMDLDFVGIKPGDIDGTAKVTSLMDNMSRSVNRIGIDLEWQNGFAEMTIPQGNDLEGVYLNMTWDDPQIEITDLVLVSEQLRTAEASWDNDIQQLRFLWVSNTESNLDEEAVIRLHLNKKPDDVSTTFELCQDNGGSEAYDGDLTRYELCWADHLHSGNNLLERLQVEQNRPNPFDQSTIITYYVPDADNVRLQVWEASGRLVMSKYLEVGPGWHEIELNRTELGNGGIYHYLLVGNTGQAGRRMIIME